MIQKISDGLSKTGTSLCVKKDRLYSGANCTANLRYLILALTTRCNLRCAYCYHGEQVDPTDMRPEIIDASFDLASAGSSQLHLQISGGEPTLVPELIDQAVYRARHLRRPCTIGIQTNGTALTGDLVRLFKKQHVQIGISLDDPPSIHQEVRGGVAETIRGLHLLEEHGVPFRVTAVVGDHNSLTLDRLVMLLAAFRQARGIALDLLICKGRAESGMQPADADNLRSGLRAMADTLAAVNRHRAIPLKLREIEKIMSPGIEDRGPQPFCHACLGHSMAVHPDGRIFPCGQTLGDSRFAAGTVWQPEFGRLIIRKEVESSDERCHDCPLQGRCPGDCPSRLFYNENRAVESLSCVMYRTLSQTRPVRDNRCRPGLVSPAEKMHQ